MRYPPPHADVKNSYLERRKSTKRKKKGGDSKEVGESYLHGGGGSRPGRSNDVRGKRRVEGMKFLTDLR